MAEGESRSDVSREEAHGHIEHEGIVSKVFRTILAPFGLLQPDDDYVYVPPEKAKDPLEDTPEEEMQELEKEKRGQFPS